PGPDAGPLRGLAPARLLRGRRAMTAVAQRADDAAPARSFSDRSPISRSYRRYLAKASITMFAVLIISGYLLPLLYMVTTAFQQPGQSTTPGPPPWPATPLTAMYQ